MKQLFLSLAFASIILFASAQTTLTNKNHAIKSGDSHHFIIANNVEEGLSGANQVWDFSKLTYSKDLVSHMLPPSASDNSDKIPQSNVVIEEFGNKFYFKVQKDIVYHYGTVSCDNSSILKFDDPSVKMVFPFKYGDAYQKNFTGEQLYKDGNATPVSGLIRIEADAYGKIILPGGISVDNVLRHKTIQKTVYGNCGESTIVTYRWYCSSVRYPLVTIIKHEAPEKSTTIQTAYYADYKAELKKADDEGDANIDILDLAKLSLKVSPNPFTENLKISYLLTASTNVKLMIIDNTGRSVITKENGLQDKGSHSINIESKEGNLVPGIYYVKLIVNDQVFTEMITKVK